MPVRAVFLWHLHQPEYRDPDTGRPILPWVRQHASRAYNDMAAALERYPQVKAVVNWAPSLLAQLDAYVGGTQDADEALARRPSESLTPEERAHVLREDFSADWNVWVRPVARYEPARLVRGEGRLRRASSRYANRCQTLLSALAAGCLRSRCRA